MCYGIDRPGSCAISKKICAPRGDRSWEVEEILFADEGWSLIVKQLGCFVSRPKRLNGMLASWRYFMGRPVFIPELPEAQRLAEEASVGTSSRFDFSGAYLEKSDEVAFKRMG